MGGIRKGALLLSLLGIAWGHTSAGADVVRLNNGRTLRGQITFRDEQFTFITLYSGGELILHNHQIVSTQESDSVPTPPAVVQMATTAAALSDGENNVPPQPTATPTLTPTPSPTMVPTPAWLRPIRFRLFDKQELRTLLARRFVYHIIVEEEVSHWEAKRLLVQLMKRYRAEEKWADAIEVRFYGLDPKGKRYEWPFAVADYAPEGDWSKAEANTPSGRFLLRLKINDKIEYLRP